MSGEVLGAYFSEDRIDEIPGDIELQYEAHVHHKCRGEFHQHVNSVRVFRLKNI